MNNDHYIILIYKNLKGEISPSESEQLNLWLEHPEHEEIERNLRNEWHLSGNYEPQIKIDDIDLDEEYRHLRNRIFSDETDNSNVVPIRPRNNAWIKYAASLVILLVASVWIYTTFNIPVVELATIETTTGETKEVQLTDGTMVTINENSRFSYPEEFRKNNRLVELDGEAFFDVTPNPDAPFQIKTTHTLTTVLGTSFNIEDYKNDNEAVLAVYQGKVRFEDKNNSSTQAMLSKGQKANYSKTYKQIETGTFSFLNDNSWKTHILTFSDTPLENVVSDIEEYFGNAIKISPSISDCTFNSRIDLKQTTLSDILDNISTSFQATVLSHTNDSYEIVGGKCK